MAMTRKEFMAIIKVYMLSFLCALPIIIGLDILINQYVSLGVLIIIDVIILLIASVCGYLINEKRKKSFARKREEFLASKGKNTKDE